MRKRASDNRRNGAPTAFGIAALAGLLHAAASYFWAAGGRWQLESVGGWAVELAHDHPIGAGLALGLMAVLKTAAAVVPVLNERRRGRFYKHFRICGWMGGTVLVLWGGLSTLSAWAVLGGVITPVGGYNRSTMIGHAVVWDPLFLVWGVALVIALWLTKNALTEHDNSSAAMPFGHLDHRSRVEMNRVSSNEI